MSKSFEEMLEKVSEILRDKEDKVVEKKVKMKPEAIKLYKELEGLEKEQENLKAKRSAIHNEMWGKIRRELGYPAKDLHIDKEKHEIWIYKD